MERANKYLGYVILAFIIFWIVRVFYRDNQFKGDFKITTGRVNSITTPGWKAYGDYSLLYEYTVNGIRYRSNKNYKLCNNQSRDIVGSFVINKFFPVAYSVKDASQSVMIMTQDDANMFRYTIADSLLSYDSLMTCK